MNYFFTRGRGGPSYSYPTGIMANSEVIPWLSKPDVVAFDRIPTFFGESCSVRGEVIAPTASYFIGPHEAGNLPNIGDKVSGDPMVIILRAGDAASWRSTLTSTRSKPGRDSYLWRGHEHYCRPSQQSLMTSTT